jgi:hypothetical protein
MASTAFIVAPLSINWVRVPPALWLRAVAVLAGAVTGAARAGAGLVSPARTRSGAPLAPAPRWRAAR